MSARGSYVLPPETFAKGGLYVFSRMVPAKFLDTNFVPVHCNFDRAEPPSARDPRQLGAVVTDIGLHVN